jgi:hypothetical protein
MSCGVKLKDNSKFCGHCGQKIQTKEKSRDDESLVKQEESFDMTAPVIPLTQASTTEDGEVTIRRVKPLTYALMSWVKKYKGLEDTIDIAEDENSAEWEITHTTSVGLDFQIYINTYENPGIISMFIYYLEENVAEDKVAAAKQMLFEINNEHPTGKFQLVGDDKILRYYSGINVSGLASEDPEYTGEHLISPKLIDNMFDDGIAAMENFIDDFSVAAYDAE